MRLLTATFLIVISCYARGQIKCDSLNAGLNSEIKLDRESLPPSVKVAFFVDGKQLRERFEISLFQNGNKIEQYKNRRIKVFDLKDFSETDSIYLACRYRKVTIVTRKFSKKNLAHGGILRIGYVNSYAKLNKEYFNEESRYYQKYHESRLPTILQVINKEGNGINQSGDHLEYYIMNYNASSFFIPNYRFISNAAQKRLTGRKFN